jgi:hypothetical protein
MKVKMKMNKKIHKLIIANNSELLCFHCLCKKIIFKSNLNDNDDYNFVHPTKIIQFFKYTLSFDNSHHDNQKLIECLYYYINYITEQIHVLQSQINLLLYKTKVQKTKENRKEILMIIIYSMVNY